MSASDEKDRRDDTNNHIQPCRGTAIVFAIINVPMGCHLCLTIEVLLVIEVFLTVDLQ